MSPALDPTAEIKSPRDRAREIIRAVEREFGVKHSDLMGRKTTRLVVDARHEAIRRVRAALPRLSTPELGRIFKRDYSTIIPVLNPRVRARKAARAKHVTQQRRAARNSHAAQAAE